jgi:hypothetical protein
MPGLVPGIFLSFPRKRESSNRRPSIILNAVGYWIARIIKLVLGLAKPDPSAGQ